MKVKDLLGMKVLDTDAKEVGKVVDADFDNESGQIQKLTISLKKNIISSDEVVVRYDNIKSIGDYVLLDVNIIKG
ncbi:MAG: PRC-barrel domain-containing protein [Methanobrevibacter boviskoreani]|jgi:sporulation protein YlmC with PRC-barrel domain|uniref:PRC-barrel domain-containing protein n=1 Tax=Methanobrevibacter boviskoreani TaxID=1348249 RepID=UPI0023A8EB89|nr:PRC-barrel domain-containing protein [Methanobrevibacter boviskoreani]MCI6775280.1 PRC-barrel domain-containing protein [Methanobrevibacter boviskoreani]